MSFWKWNRAGYPIHAPLTVEFELSGQKSDIYDLTNYSSSGEFSLDLSVYTGLWVNVQGWQNFTGEFGIRGYHVVTHRYQTAPFSALFSMDVEDVVYNGVSVPAVPFWMYFSGECSRVANVRETILVNLDSVLRNNLVLDLDMALTVSLGGSVHKTIEFVSDLTQLVGLTHTIRADLEQITKVKSVTTLCLRLDGGTASYSNFYWDRNFTGEV